MHQVKMNEVKELLLKIPLNFSISYLTPNEPILCKLN